ncbi:protein disulfide-isomerase MPD1 precursor [Westerdykella ornata]|uniref:protein disulfide-isomerase n=1 Tax=Westerdykella ornata TaxID=318751 RepID=A0A6A6JXK5_WESOR|nr:protein disulfide-isomerase MPD1 precursor [Westerdykella ornata]KAF2281352.1 protein disulfide-isomerase MPD1 precursor [Westerdykella ornata]
MVRTSALVTAAASLALGVKAESLYSKNSAVLQITGTDYDRVIAKSNYTSIVEFYAPWCGHCQNLKPAYESAAKSLAGVAKVAAVNCNDELNKPFCGKMGVKGFPTLKIVRPSAKRGKPTVEDYQGQRTAKAIVDAVKDKIPNNVKRVTDKNLDEWLQDKNETAKAILFTDKGAISATLRTLAIDFAGLVSIAQIRNREAKAVETFGVESFPTLILLPGGTSTPIKYDGELQKSGMVEFLSQVAPPHADCPPPNPKKAKAKDEKKNDKKASKSSSKFAKASASHKSADASSAAASATAETVEEPAKPSESPDPKVNEEEDAKPVVLPEEELKPTIPVLSQASDLQATCLNEKSKTCVLALLPKDESSEAVVSVLDSLASIHKKHDKSGSHLFPFVAVPASNSLASSLIADLKIGDTEQVHLIATNGKRGWWKRYSGSSFGDVEVEQWIDAIRMGEGQKEKLPASILAAGKADTREQEPEKEKTQDQQPIKAQEEKIVEEQQKHDEL